jgi:hypothetical protein
MFGKTEGARVAMSEEEWRRCSETNPLFAAMEPPTEAQLAAFNLACCRRIRHLITDDITLQALDALEGADDATIPAELALAANQVEASSAYFDPASPLFDPSRNSNAAKAVGHAVCRSLPPGSFHYWKDALDNARLVALYSQWAVGHAADPDRDADAEDPYGTNDEAEPGLTWLRQCVQKAEASAQCGLIRTLFARRVESGYSQEAEPTAAPDPAGT